MRAALMNTTYSRGLTRLGIATSRSGVDGGGGGAVFTDGFLGGNNSGDGCIGRFSARLGAGSCDCVLRRTGCGTFRASPLAGRGASTTLPPRDRLRSFTSFSSILARLLSSCSCGKPSLEVWVARNPGVGRGRRVVDSRPPNQAVFSSRALSSSSSLASSRSDPY